MWYGLIGGAIAGWFGNEATRAQADANNMLSALNAEVGNKVRVAQNAATAAQNNLDRWIQSVNNNKVLDQGGEALEANAINYRRMSDVGIQQDFATSIRNAEQMGHAAAAAAASGIDGNVVDMVNGSTALRDSIVRQGIDDKRHLQAYDVARRAGNIMSQTINGMDNSIILDTLDYNTNFAQITPKVSAFAAAVRGAFPYANDALNSSQQPNSGQGQVQYRNEYKEGSLGIRQRSSSPYDLADAAQDKYGGNTFSWNTSRDSAPDSPYQLWDGNASLSIKDYSAADNDMYGLYSR